MKNLFSLFLILCSFYHSKAATDITIPTVSGTWTLAGSPYKIFNNISIPPGQTLTIEPGVDVIFQGAFAIDVPSSSHIVAMGTAAKNISFKVNDTTGWHDKTTPTGGWLGITFNGYLYSGFTDSALTYCNFSNIKTGRIRVYARNFTCKNCNFYDNHTSSSAWGYSILSINADTTNFVKIYQCTFRNNDVDDYCSIADISGSANTHIYECTFRDNYAISALSCINNNLLLENNTFSNNIQEANLSVTGTITIKYSKAVVKGNKVYKNIGKECGALVCHNTFGDINGNNFCNNQSVVGFTGSSACGMAQGAGAVRISADDSSIHYYCTVRDNVIANNYAAFEGGGIYVFMISARIYNNDIIHNTGGDGVSYGSAGIHIHCPASITGSNSVRIRNNIFLENLGIGITNTYSVKSAFADTIDYAYNWSSNTYSNDIWDGSSGGILFTGDSTTNIVGIDPGIINPTLYAVIGEDASDKNFALLSTSPCINRGDTATTHPDAFDNSNHARIYGTTIDIGAHEYGPWTATLGATNPGIAQPTTVAIGIHPNPATNVVFITTLTAKGTVTLQDVTGHRIAEQPVNNNLTSFDIHNLPRGMYFAVWSHDGRNDMQKMIVE